tara:strand:- start:330 stop:1094 length:765 start_codon:yes stop_codon:yes gene_type:complete
MGVKIGEKKEFNSDETIDLKDIVYTLDNPELLNGDKTKFKIDIDYTGETENYYPDDLPEKYMQPYKPGDKNLSHEPYFQKFKNLQKDKLEVLRKTVLLTKWDNKNNKKKKLKIIDDIMEGRHTFDSYKYEVLNDNGITIEQEHNIFKDFSPTPAESVTLKVKGVRRTPYDIDTDIEINMPPEFTEPSITSYDEVDNIFTPKESDEMDRNIFNVMNDFIKNNSITFLVLSIIVILGIIFSLYIQSKSKGRFKLKN